MPVATTALTIGGGVIGRLVGSGIQRLGSLAFQKVIRTVKIENALKTASTKNPAVQTALNDFQTVVGSRYGQLDQQLSEFLREIERTGIINAMVENALLGRDAKEVYKLFSDLHDKAIGTSKGDPAELFDQMMRSFTVTLQELTRDRILLEAFRLHRAELETRLDRLDAALAEISRTSTSQSPSFEELRSILLKIARGLQGTYRSIRVETNKGARSVEITKIYIPPKLQYRDNAKSINKNAALTRVYAQAVKEARRDELVDLQPDPGRDRPISITYNDLRMQFNRTVILGDPGGGKSTLCQHLCHDLARQATASLQTDSLQLPAQLQKIPLRVILRSYEKARTSEPQLSIYDFIIRDLKNHVTADAAEINKALTYLLSSGAAVLAFDGLDEILATAHRREFVDLVVSFCNQYPLCPVLVTSRLVGYDDAHLPDEFDELILQRFDDEEVKSYVKKFMKVVGGHDEAESDRRASLFYGQTTNNAADLRRNPLMLGLMAWLFNMRGDVPSNRPEIYRECAVLMFEKWDPDRDIKADIPASFDRLQLFSSIASKIFGNPELSAGVEAAWLERETRGFFQRVYENHAQAYEAAKALVAFITGRAWVMSEVGDKVFAFTHQTFLEYFFARHIDDSYDTVKEVLAVLVPRIVNREWDMVSHLSLQIKTHRNLRKQDEALDQLRSTVLSQRDKARKAALISFSARALEYLAGAESHLRPLINEIFEHCLETGDAGEAAWRDARQVAHCSSERRDFACATIIKLVVEEFKRGPTERAVVVKDAISVAESQAQYWGPNFDRYLPVEVAVAAREELKSFVNERIEQSSFYAGVAWEWYGQINRSLVMRHGVITYYNTTLSGLEGINGLIAMALAASPQFHAHAPTHIGVQIAADAVAVIGAVGFSTAPFPREMFKSRKQDSIPLQAWSNMIKDDRKLRPATMVGYLFAMMLSTELAERYEEEHQLRGHKQITKRVDLISWIMNHEGVQKLKIFSQVRMIVERETVFV